MIITQPGEQEHESFQKNKISKIEQKEQHCVLLKFETLPKYSKVISISIILRISELKAVLSSNSKHRGVHALF